MKLKYKSFEFPSNPEKIEILSSTNCSSSAVMDKNSAVQNVSVNPVIVKGSGEFYGNTGEETAALIQNMLRDKRSGWLMLPFSVLLKPFLRHLNFVRTAVKTLFPILLNLQRTVQDECRKEILNIHLQKQVKMPLKSQTGVIFQ